MERQVNWAKCNGGNSRRRRTLYGPKGTDSAETILQSCKSTAQKRCRDLVIRRREPADGDGAYICALGAEGFVVNRGGAELIVDAAVLERLDARKEGKEAREGA